MKNQSWEIARSATRQRVAAMLLILLPFAKILSQDVTISSSCKVTVSTSSVIIGDDLTNNGTFDAGNATIKVGGNWNNTNTFTPGTSTVVFNGTGSQSITKTGGETFNNVTVNKSSGVLSLANDATINAILTLTSGLFSIGSNTLTLGSSATVGGTPSSSTMIVADGTGSMKKMYSGIGSFTFPIGDNTSVTEYSPYVVNFTSGSFSSAYVTARVVDAKHPNNTSTNHYLTRYWVITSTGVTSFSCNIEGYYTDADVYGSENSMTCAKWNGSSWFDLATSPDAANNKIYGTVTSFGEFTAGEAAALPVELISFTARLVKENVELKWTTATEVNNYGFDVERNAISLNGGWEKIGFVDGHGTSNTQNTYHYTDALDFRMNNAEKIYYRLKQIDRDGTQSYSSIVEVQIEQPQQFMLNQIYPNPLTASNSKVIITFTVPVTDRVRLYVVDNLGKEVAMLVDEVKEHGRYQTQFNPSSLPSGIYYYVLQSSSSAKVKKLMVVR